MADRPPSRTRTTIGFSISIAAERSGLHPQTLREYERKGLLQPQRTAGGARRFGDADVARLVRIQQLTELGLSLAGVAYVLELEDKVRALDDQVATLHAALARAEGRPVPPHQPRTAGDRSSELLPALRSLSVEIVHMPRAPRSPRWRNDG